RTRGTYLNNLGPGIAPVPSVTYPDARTATFKLAFPTVSFLPSTAYFLTVISIMPKETGNGFDPKNETRGSGPWQLKSYQPSLGAIYQKNQNWYDKDRIFFDSYETPIIPDPSQRLAQFKAGRTWLPGAITTDEIIPTKRDVSTAQMVQNDRYRGT